MKKIILFSPVIVIATLLASQQCREDEKPVMSLSYTVCLPSYRLTGNGTLQVDKAVMARGKKIYTQYCVSCHQQDGGGVPGLNPPLQNTSWVLGSKTKLIRVILKGMNTHEEIDGEEYSNTMAPFNFLKDQEISDVLTYVRNSFGNKATAVTVGDVKYVRARTK